MELRLDGVCDDVFETQPTRRLRKSRCNGAVAGVLSGVAEYFRLDLTWLRIAFVVLALSTFGTAMIIYLAMVLIMPDG